MAAMAPKMSARGLDSSEDAAPVLWGMPPEVDEEPEGLVVPEAEAEAERERVGEATVLLVPAEGLTVAEAAALEARELTLARAEEAEARTLETAAEADDRAAEAEARAEDKEPEPPEMENWPE